ncbi:MAG: glycosyltransferase family 4 protein [bacterium]
MVVLITNIPTPYRVPLFNLISEKLTSLNQQFHVVFEMLTYKRRQWKDVIEEAKFAYTILNLPKIHVGYEKALTLPLGLTKRIAALNPTCLVIVGYNMSAMISAIFAYHHNIPFIIWSGETESLYAQRFGRLGRTYIRKKLIKHTSALVAYGTAAQSYLQSIGASKDKINIAINCVDTKFFKNRVRTLRHNKKLNPKNKIKLLFVGYLQHRKGLEFVIKALNHIESDLVELDIVGDGPARGYYTKLVRSLNLSNVTFYGFIQKKELPSYYAQADIFIFPSIKELFGLVLVEAAAAGLPIIASKFAGGTMDVVKDGKNGFIVNPYDIEGLAHRIKKLCLDRKLREEMSKYSLEIINNSVNIHKSAEGFMNAVMSCGLNLTNSLIPSL